MNKVVQYNQSQIHLGKLVHEFNQTEEFEYDFNQLLQKDYQNSKKIIITDETIFKHWGEFIVTEFPELAKAEIIQFPAGEEYKTIEVCTQIWAAMSEYEISRNDLVINLGGGVVTDLGGLVASLYKRGLHFINIPTTLLAQVDASVGGKTAVDLGPYKNQIGLFSDPDHVLIDERFLTTLEKEQLLSGFAEMLKHGLIADEKYWNKLKEVDLTNEKSWLDFIEKSVQIKKKIVEKDHRESGLRKILNFGHSIGHGIEGYLLNQNNSVLHGYAVAWGMLAEANIALQQNLIQEDVLNQIKAVVNKLYPNPPIVQGDFKGILQLIYNDKKNKEGQLLFTLIDRIGHAVYDQKTTDKQVLEALKFISNN